MFVEVEDEEEARAGWRRREERAVFSLDEVCCPWTLLGPCVLPAFRDFDVQQLLTANAVHRNFEMKHCGSA